MKGLETRLKNRRMFVGKADNGSYQILTRRLFDSEDWNEEDATCHMKKTERAGKFIVSTSFCLTAEAIEALYESYMCLNGGVASWTLIVNEEAQ